MTRVIVEFKSGEYSRIARWANSERRTTSDQIAYVVLGMLRRVERDAAAKEDSDDTPDSASEGVS